MTLREAERDARKLLESSWWSNSDCDAPLPVEPEELAEGLGIRVRLGRLPSDESGRIVIPEVGDPVISLNASDHPNRQRFTCAHEIGHYVRRQRLGQVGEQTFTDRRATLAGLGVDTEEIYANQFAAALLMPAHLVRQEIQAGRRAGRLARMFGTSEQAIEVRLRNLGLSA